MGTTEVSTTFAVTVTADRLGRTVAVIPDEIAIRLRTAALANFKDYPEIAYGESEVFPADSRVAQSARTILDAIVEHAEDADDRRRAVRGDFYGFVVGESGWDTQDHTWSDYKATQHLHTPGSISTSYDGTGSIRFTG